jgi:hypothetical protein
VQRPQQAGVETVEEHLLHQGGMARGGPVQRVGALRGQHGVGGPGVGAGRAAANQAAVLHAQYLVGDPAPLPADAGRQVAQLETAPGGVGQRVEDVEVLVREVAVGLQLAVDLVVEP